MLQIRLNKDSSAEGGGPKLAGETVTVACPDHLVLADLPVAKSLGVVSAATVVKTIGRRSRRQLGERVHFCVRCDFPIAIYGRLTPCEHAFCLDCARSDSVCYLCEERIQKIQTIKMMEGIFICAAPHCLKSFLKRDEFESHVHETHSNLLQPTVVKEESNDPSVLESTARAPSRPGFSPSSNSQPPFDRQQQPRPQFFGQMPNRPSEPQPNYAVPITPNLGQNAPPGFNHPHFQSEGTQPFYNGYEMQQQDSVPESGSKQGSLLGFPPGQVAVGMNFPTPYPQQWNAGGAGVAFAPPLSSQGYPDAFMNMADSQGPASFHGGFGQQGSRGTS